MKKSGKDKDIERVLNEYKEFLYIVSHDFNAPLRHIREFSKLLLQDIGDQNLSDSSKEYVGFIEDSIERLMRMQEALITLSRVQTRGSEFEHVNMNEILEEIKNDTTADKAVLEFDDLPIVNGDEQQIRQLLSALIDNAIKFSAQSAPTNINIKATPQETFIRFAVSDNGKGIDAEHTKDVFKLFRRLNPAIHPDSVGMGLTLSQKIIERHGGEIWLESSKEQGTTVFFTLPKAA